MNNEINTEDKEIGRAVNSALRKYICEQWHYSNYGEYDTFDDMPEELQLACVEAGKSAIQCAADNHYEDINPFPSPFDYE